MVSYEEPNHLSYMSEHDNTLGGVAAGAFQYVVLRSTGIVTATHPVLATEQSAFQYVVLRSTGIMTATHPVLATEQSGPSGCSLSQRKNNRH